MPRPINPKTSPPVILGICGCGCEGPQCRIGTDTIGYTTVTPFSEESQTLTVLSRDSEIPCGDAYYNWSCVEGSLNKGTGVSVVYTAPVAGLDTIYLRAKCPDHPESWEGVLVDVLEVIVGGECECTGNELININGVTGHAILDAGSIAYEASIDNKHPTLPCGSDYTWTASGFSEAYLASPSGAVNTFHPGTVTDTGTISLYCKGDLVDVMTVDISDPSGCTCTTVEEITGGEDGVLIANSYIDLGIRYVSSTNPCHLMYTWTITSDSEYLLLELSFLDDVASGQNVTIMHSGNELGIFTVHLYCKGNEYDTLELEVVPCLCTGEEQITGEAFVRPDTTTLLSIDPATMHPDAPCDFEYEWRVNAGYNPGGVCYISGSATGNSVLFVAGEVAEEDEGLAVVEIRCREGEWGRPFQIWVSQCVCDTDEIAPPGPLSVVYEGTVLLEVDPATMHPYNPCGEDPEGNPAYYEWEIDSGPAGCSLSHIYGTYTVFTAGTSTGNAVVALYCRRDLNPGYRDSVVIEIKDPTACTCTGNEAITGDSEYMLINTQKALGISGVHPSDPCTFQYTWNLTSEDPALLDNLSFLDNNAEGQEVTVVHSGFSTGEFAVNLYCKGAGPKIQDITVIPCLCTGEEQIIGSSYAEPNSSLNLFIDPDTLHDLYPCGSQYQWRVNPGYNPGGACYISGSATGTSAIFIAGNIAEGDEGLAVVEIRCRGGMWGAPFQIQVYRCLCYTDDITPSGPVEMDLYSGVFLQVDPASMHPDIPCSSEYSWEIDSQPGDCSLSQSSGTSTYFYSGSTRGQAIVALYCRKNLLPGFRDYVVINIIACCNSAHIEGPEALGAQEMGYFSVVANPGKSLCDEDSYSWQIRQGYASSYLLDYLGYEVRLVAARDTETITLDLYCEGAVLEDSFTLVAGCGDVRIYPRESYIQRWVGDAAWFHRSASLRMDLNGAFGTCSPGRYSWSENTNSTYISGSGTTVDLVGQGCSVNGTVTVRLDGSTEDTLPFQTYGGYTVQVISASSRQAEVRVRTEGGSAVNNLTSSNFKIYVNGTLASITGFQAPTSGLNVGNIFCMMSLCFSRYGLTTSTANNLRKVQIEAAYEWADRMKSGDRVRLVLYGGATYTYSVKNKSGLITELNWLYANYTSMSSRDSYMRANEVPRQREAWYEDFMDYVDFYRNNSSYPHDYQMILATNCNSNWYSIPSASDLINNWLGSDSVNLKMWGVGISPYSQDSFQWICANAGKSPFGMYLNRGSADVAATFAYYADRLGPGAPNYEISHNNSAGRGVIEVRAENTASCKSLGYEVEEFGGGPLGTSLSPIGVSNYGGNIVCNSVTRIIDGNSNTFCMLNLEETDYVQVTYPSSSGSIVAKHLELVIGTHQSGFHLSIRVGSSEYKSVNMPGGSGGWMPDCNTLPGKASVTLMFTSGLGSDNTVRIYGESWWISTYIWKVGTLWIE